MDLLIARGHTSAEPVVGEDTGSEARALQKALHRSDVARVAHVAAFDVAVEAILCAEEILTERVVEIVRIRNRRGDVAQRTFDEADAVVDVEQPREGAGRRHEPRPLL